MAIRKRSFDEPGTGSYVEHHFSNGYPNGQTTLTTTNFSKASGTVEDVVPGWGQVNPFELTRYENHLQGVSGVKRTNVWQVGPVPWYEFHDAMPFVAFKPDHWPLITKNLTNVEALARMSPNQPSVDLPLFMFELKDLPGMAKAVQSFGKSLPAALEKIRDGGWAAFGDKANRKSALARLSGFQLGLGMGYAPLANDLAAMLGLGEAVKRRLDELNRLKSAKGLRKRIAIDSRTDSSVREFVSYGDVAGQINIVGSVTETKTTRVWSTSVWKEIGGIMPTVDGSELAAVRSVLGLNISAASIWNAIPWSFLVDYFTDIGAYLDTQRNSLENRCIRFAMMKETIATTTYSPILLLGGDVTGGGGSIKAIGKSRTPIDPSSLKPGFTPFLSANQASSLASLSVARRNVWTNK